MLAQIIVILLNMFKIVTKLFAGGMENQNWNNAPEIEEEKTVVLPKAVAEKLIEKPKIKEYAFPVKILRITSAYGWRILLGKKRWHNGVDYAGSNKVAHAPFDGIVTKVLAPDDKYPVKFKWDHSIKGFKWDTSVPSNRAWTPYLILLCAWDKNVRALFKHVRPKIEAGQKVKVGETLCNIGNWGYSMGAHLHFEIQLMKNGKWVNTDPVKFLAKRVNRKYDKIS